jgi:TATA-binding protein-associated factor
LQNYKDPFELPLELLQRREQERTFIDQLLGAEKVSHYQIPVTINATLRPYQQEGVDWLAFLKKYRLHGVLCDDMGLGKTLQTICILAGDHFEQRKEFQNSSTRLPSLVVCPPTILGHWYHEILKFCTEKILSPMIYAGSPQARSRCGCSLAEVY